MGSDQIKNRRKVLIGLTGSIAGATQLPNKWIKPVVDSVVLPVHAQTSATTTTTVPTTTTTTTTTTAPLPTSFRQSILLNTNFVLNNIPEKIFSNLIPQAYAQSGIPADLCITSNDGMSFQAKMLYDFDGSHFHEGTGTVGPGATGFAHTSGCFPVNLNISVTAITQAGVDYNITGELTSMGNVGIGSGCPSPVGCE